MRCDFLCSVLRLVVGIVVEVALNVDDGRALIAAAARQVAERADQVGQAAGRRALGHHVADQALAGLLADALFDGFLQRLAPEITEVIVGEVLELQLVRRADKALGVAGGDNGISELPDLADGVFERTVAEIAGDYAVLVSESGTRTEVALALLPDGIREGTVLICENFEYRIKTL